MATGRVRPGPAIVSKTAMADVSRRLNLGCAQFPLEGYLNVDLSLRTPAELICNLDQVPFPFANGSFDEIRASHVLEHLHRPFDAMAECHRLLRPGGRLSIKVPHCSRGFTHPDHKCAFDVSFPLFFDPEKLPWYTGTPFRLHAMRLRWNAQPYLKRWVAGPVARGVAAGLGTVIDALANRMPYVASRLWAGWVGGFEEIEFHFERLEDRAVARGGPAAAPAS